MKKRNIALLLALVTVFTMVLQIIPPVAASEKYTAVYYDGAPISEITVLHSEKKTLTAHTVGIEAPAYQWQILMDAANNIWVNIYDMTQDSCDVSHALVQNLMDASDSAYIRCAVTDAVETLYTDPVCVTISFASSVTLNEEPMTLLTELVVEEPETEISPSPEVTDDPAVSASPEVTDEPAVSASPEVSDDPEASASPAVTDEPEVSASPEVTDEPESTASPEVTDEPEASDSPEVTDAVIVPGSGTPMLMTVPFAMLAVPAPQAGDAEYVTVTIKYLDLSSLDGAEASVYSPYVATIEKGSAFKQNVISPTFLGFAPYYDADTTDADTAVDDDASYIALDYAAVNENIVINVYYKPIEVGFAIRYFFQNIHDDLYTENVALYHTGKAETGTLISNEYLTAHAGDTTGFEKMYHIPEHIAADGSTVFECYYDRNYYLIQFDQNGGYGVDPIYARYGTPFIVNDPIRHGYTFAGWDELNIDTDGDEIPDAGNGIADNLPDTIPAANKKYVALWKTVNTTYTIVYWQENANDDGYSYWGHATRQATSASIVNAEDTAAADGMTDAQHFLFNSALSDRGVLVEGDGTTILNVYYTRKFYTITFKATGKCTIAENHTHSVENGCYDYICVGGSHTHTPECLICTETEHTHSMNCCVQTAHTHSANCCSIPYHTADADCCTIPEHTVHNSDCCSIEVHTNANQHTVECFANVGNRRYNTPDGAPKNPTPGQIYSVDYGWWGKASSIYIGGNWYEYSGSLSSGQVASTSCHIHGDGTCNCDAYHAHGSADCVCPDEHTHAEGTCNTENCENNGLQHVHGVGDCTCGLPVHTHTGQCYNCGFSEHTHSDACLRLNCSIAENHTHSSNCNNSNRTNTVKVVRRKYQQSLDDIWFPDGSGILGLEDDNGVVYNDGQRWDPSDTNLYSEVLVYISAMPADDFTLTVNISSNPTRTMRYYLQVLPGSAYDVVYDGKYYKLNKTITANYGKITKAEDYFDIKGYTQYESDPPFSGNDISAYEADFYYDRRKAPIQFVNNRLDMTDAEVSAKLPGKELEEIMFGTPLEDYCFVPDYPANLEPNAYYFDGWYTTDGCYEGTEVDWDTITMTEGAMRLYANWVPKTHKVNFFTTLDEMTEFETEPTSVTPVYTYPAVTHGEVVGSVENPDIADDGNLNLIFAGWFYLENGQKKAFSPLDMPVNRDINVFADWSSHTPQPYRIRYVLLTDPDVEVAPPTTGFAYGGATRTFTAKAGDPYNQLYAAYNSGYFPTVGSHSITMQYEEDHDDPIHNVYTFYYVKAENIEYTVRYVNKETNTPLCEDVVHTTSAAVVTERFKVFENMVPDQFYKRLVISVKWDAEQNKYVGTEDNILTFYYTPNTTSAFYAVHFLQEKLHDPNLSDAEVAALQNQYYIDGTGGYEEVTSHLEGTGDVNSDIPIIPLNIPGFSLIEDKAVTTSGADDTTPESCAYEDGEYTITVTADGTDLYIFYRRNEYNYVVNYYLYNSTDHVDAVNFPSKNGSLPYDTTLTETAASISGYTCVSAQTTQSISIRDDEALNVINFYYAPVQYVAEYVALPPEGGWLSQTIEVVSGTQALTGSVPTAYTYYKFEGWYLDEDCTLSAADMGTVDPVTNGFTPDKTKLSETERNIFYAKFSLLAGDLTITRANAENDGQVFVYEVKNEATGDTVYVTVVGNGSVTIHDVAFGDYTITQQNGWSWRYDDVIQTHVSHQGAAGTTVQFSEGAETNQWLNGNSSVVVNRRGGTT